MTHTHHHTPRTGRPPLAVWPCAPHTDQPSSPRGGGVLVPRRLAHRLVAEYTRPGEVVADLTGTGLVAEQATTMGRFCEVAETTSVQHPQQTQKEEGEVAWADLTVAFLPATPDQDQQGYGRWMRARVVFAATLTRPGGIIAAITDLGHTLEGAVVDPAPGLVRAAGCAGLVYLQHVLAITAPICEAGLGKTLPARGAHVDPDQAEVGAGLSVSVAEAAATLTSPAHLNVSVFRVPKKGHTLTADTPGQVGA